MIIVSYREINIEQFSSSCGNKQRRCLGSRHFREETRTNICREKRRKCKVKWNIIKIQKIQYENERRLQPLRLFSVGHLLLAMVPGLKLKQVYRDMSQGLYHWTIFSESVLILINKSLDLNFSFTFVCFNSFKMVFQAGLKITIQPRLTLSSESFLLHFKHRDDRAAPPSLIFFMFWVVTYFPKQSKSFEIPKINIYSYCPYVTW